jgi:hypothetical protein
VDPRLFISLVIIGGTIIELAIVWNLNLLSNELIRYLAGIVVVFDILALLKILLEI